MQVPGTNTWGDTTQRLQPDAGYLSAAAMLHLRLDLSRSHDLKKEGTDRNSDTMDFNMVNDSVKFS